MSEQVSHEHFAFNDVWDKKLVFSWDSLVYKYIGENRIHIGSTHVVIENIAHIRNKRFFFNKLYCIVIAGMLDDHYVSICL